MTEYEHIYHALQARDHVSAEAAALLHVRSTETWLHQVLNATPTTTKTIKHLIFQAEHLVFRLRTERGRNWA